MDRYAFLATLWKKGLKPILLSVAISFCIVFIYNIITEDGTERVFALFILSVTLFILFIELFVNLFAEIIRKFFAKMPEKLKRGIRLIIRLLNYLAPFILSVIIYQAWQRDWTGTALIIGILFVQKIIDLVTERKDLEKT
ncbi:MAG: hypothetical protein ACI8ZM_005617 [Crocinitomix sp.]|jgi:hypothetical protein